VNNSLFHQLAEQLQQQNLEHLRQQLLEQQQPQKVRTPSCGCHLAETCRVNGMSSRKCIKQKNKYNQMCGIYVLLLLGK